MRGKTLHFLDQPQYVHTMGKKGKRGDRPAEKKAFLKRLDALIKRLEDELKGVDLFAPLPPLEDCPICLVPFPRMTDITYYQGCCGKFICHGCFEENEKMIKKMNLKKRRGSAISHTCPFCRELEPTTGEDYLCQLEVRASKGDDEACNMLGGAFEQGLHGLAVDKIKALHYKVLAVQFGSAEAPRALLRCSRKGSTSRPIRTW